MGFYDTDEGVATYAEMCEGYDSSPLIAEVKRHLPAGATLLELGSGLGKDAVLLAETYRMTGSDLSEAFLKRLRAELPDLEFLRLDAVSVATKRRFDAIYSNKVLHHLTPEDLTTSMARQALVVRPGGSIFHALWRGDHEETHAGMRFIYYTGETFAAHLPPSLELMSVMRYTEYDEDDSLWVVLRRAAG